MAVIICLVDVENISVTNAEASMVNVNVSKKCKNARGSNKLDSNELGRNKGNNN